MAVKPGGTRRAGWRPFARASDFERTLRYSRKHLRSTFVVSNIESNGPFNVRRQWWDCVQFGASYDGAASSAGNRFQFSRTYSNSSTRFLQDRSLACSRNGGGGGGVSLLRCLHSRVAKPFSTPTAILSVTSARAIRAASRTFLSRSRRAAVPHHHQVVHRRRQ
jgi:hypothetical protein